MNRNEARKLLGGYATGSLTEAERQLLFTAALEDQELFDELAGEQTLKELLEEPGVRARLAAALEPERPQRSWWPWAAAVTIAGLATLGLWLAQRRDPPQQLAQNATQDAVTLPSQAQVTAPEAPPPAAGSTAATPMAQPVRAARTNAAGSADNSLPKAAAPVQEQGALAGAPPAPTAATESLPVPAGLENRKQTLPVLTPPPPAAAKGVAARSAFLADAAAPLAYDFPASGTLRVTPHVAGTLEVRSGQAVLFEENAVPPEVPVNVTIPAGTAQVRIEFSVTGQAPTVLNVPVPR